MTKRFRKKPDTTEVEAVQWTGGNIEEITALAGPGHGWAVETARPGDYVLKLGDGVVVAVAKEKFEATYEPADQGLDGGGLEDLVKLAMRAFCDPAQFTAREKVPEGPPRTFNYEQLYDWQKRAVSIALADHAASTQPVVDLDIAREAQVDIHEAERIAADWATRNSDADSIVTCCGRVREFLDALLSDPKEKGTEG